MTDAIPVKEKNDLRELAGLFLKLGFTAFGGPAAHIAMMRQEVVIKREWLTEQHFLDLIGATNLIPGPNSTEMAIHIGQERGGWRGLLITGACFIMPAVLITGCFAALYKIYGQLPQVQPFIYGIKPAIIAVIIAAIYPLAKKSLQTVELGIIGLAALLLSLWGVSEIVVLFGAGFVALGLAAIRLRRSQNLQSFLPIAFLHTTDARFFSASNVSLFLSFLKIGAILYGSGYVLFAFLDAELVARGVISHRQLIDAIAVGQFTPGPVFSSVTFIGYQVNGISGAVVSTIGIFLPSFLFVALLNPLVRKMRGSKLLAAFLNAVNVASIALILVVCFQLGKDSLTNWREITIAVCSAIILFRFKQLNSAFIVLGGALAGYLLLLI
ncbi:chromate efflux transporter [Mucilaginibacter sp. BJC16-A38]|uniref:chromate efflux transporter n=1 Tax=Mucilaginibacter phenanthrenivorans TaxID=1234842 RepID=UPI0021580991|nr:chromate efflux transporter [Mucilaginibacter phenanthrenivorans]MCR8560899.1 chromate efflux transporter [Mucilaginibacter phenanthrenivorans]